MICPYYSGQVERIGRDDVLPEGVRKIRIPTNREDKPLYVVKELPMTVDVTSPDVKELDKLNRQVDLVGLPVLAIAIILLLLVLGFQIDRWLG